MNISKCNFLKMKSIIENNNYVKKIIQDIMNMNYYNNPNKIKFDDIKKFYSYRYNKNIDKCYEDDSILIAVLNFLDCMGNFNNNEIDFIKVV